MVKVANLRVLVVDDVLTIQKLLTKNLNELGITDIQTSDSPDESWDIIVNDYKAGKPIDLIISDWHMPKGDGLKLLEALRSSKNAEWRLTKFIMMTGANEKTLISIDKGANNVMHKPFTLESLKEKLELVIGELDN